MIAIPKILSQLCRSYCSQGGDGLEVKVVSEENFKKAKAFLEKHFCKQDPLHVCLKLHSRKESVEAFDKYLRDIVKSELSIMMLNKRKNVIGLCLNRKIEQNKKFRAHDELLQRIMELVEKVDEQCDLFHKFGVKRYLKTEILSIDPFSEKFGVEKKLMEVTRFLTRQNDLKLMRLDCTSHYAAKVAPKLGFMPIYSVKYENYRLGKIPVFKPDPPHTEYSVFIQTVDQVRLKPREKYPGRHLPYKPLEEFV